MMEHMGRKSGLAGLLIGIGLLLAFSFGLLQFDGRAEEETVLVTVSYGYHNYGKAGRNLPVYFHLENESAASFSGMVQVIINQNEDEILLFEKKVLLQGGESRTEAVFTTIPAGISQIYVKVLAADGQCLVSQPMSIRMNAEASELFIGILTDRPEELSYFGSQRINDEGLLTKVFYFTEKDFPGLDGELDLLDVIVISDFDTTGLSEVQVSNLISWMLDGGTLLLGIGNRHEQILGGLPEALTDISIGAAKVIRTDLGVAHFAVIEDDNYVEIPFREIEIPYALPVFTSGGYNLILRESKEKGNLAVAGFSFSDISAYCNENTSYISTLLTQLISKERLRSINQEAVFGDYSRYWNIKNTVSMGNTEKLPSPRKYLLVIVVYILVAGPGLYLLVKKLDKRRYYGMSVIATALVTAVIIYLSGWSTRFTRPFFIYSTIVEFEEEYVNEVSYLNLMAPTHDAYSIVIDDAYSVMPVARDSYYFPQQTQAMTGDEEHNVAIEYGDGETMITVQNAPAFTSKLFRLEKKERRQNYGVLNYEISYFDGMIDGYIENKLGYDLERAAIIMYGQVITIGDITAGERISLRELEADLYPPGYTYHVARMIAGGELESMDIKNAEYRQSLERAALLQHYLGSVFPEATMKARLVAFTTERDSDKVTVDRDYDAHGITMISFPVMIDYRNGSRIYFPRLLENPKVVMGNYLEGSNTIYGSEPVILEYQFNRNLGVEGFTFSYPDEDTEFSYFTPFSGNIFFYNYETQRYDLMSELKDTFAGREIAPYLTLNNTIRVRYEITEDAEYRWDISLPVISFIGREDYAED